jgi:hypothetical protein
MHAVTSLAMAIMKAQFLESLSQEMLAVANH